MPRAMTSLARILGVLGTSLGLSVAVGLATFAAGLTVAGTAEASSPYLEIPDPAVVMQTPAYRYANMSDDEAFAELDRRNILYSRVGSAPGVRAPIRLTGRLHGVLIRSALPPEERASSIFEICDARLALALDDFAVILERHDVEEIVHFTMYRPNVPQAVAAQATSGASSASFGRTEALTLKTARAGDAVPVAASAASASGPTGGLEGRVGRLSKRRAFLDEKGTKSSKAHSSGLRGPIRSGESRHKELGEDLAPLENLSGGLEPSLAAKGAQLSESAEPVSHAQGAKTAPIPPNGKATAGAPKKWGATPPVLGSKKLGAPKLGGPKLVGGKLAGTKVGSKLGGAVGFDDEQLHGKWAPPGTRHPAGLAIDVGSLKKKNGKVLSVAASFGGRLGERTCGAGAPVPDSEDASELRSIVCEAHDAGIFTYTLTPNYNVAHRDHFHMEIKPGVLWFLYH